MIVEIKKNGINGEGIAYIDKMPIFVPGTLVSEKVDIEIIKSFPTYKLAKVKHIIKKAETRVSPLCRYYKKCGACNLMHCSYDEQLHIKTNLLKEALFKYAGIDTEIEIERADEQLAYRNCLKLPIVEQDGVLNTVIYYADSNKIVSFDSCLIHSELLEKLRIKILSILNKHNLKAYDRKSKKGLRYLILREIGKRAHLAIITGNDRLSEDLVKEIDSIKEIVSFYQGINTSRNTLDHFGSQILHLSGGKYLNFKIDDLKFNLSIRSFYQLNTKQAKKLYYYVKDIVDDDNELLVEAYCGIGAMSLMLNVKSKNVVGIEYIKDAVVNATNNARINKLDNVSFLCGDAATVMSNEFYHKRISTLIVDPPRSGLNDDMLNVLLDLNIEKIIYVSCNPATLAKNLAVLNRRFKIASIKAFDMFPNTSHVETVVLMSRKNNQ